MRPAVRRICEDFAFKRVAKANLVTINYGKAKEEERGSRAREGGKVSDQYKGQRKGREKRG